MSLVYFTVSMAGEVLKRKFVKNKIYFALCSKYHADL